MHVPQQPKPAPSAPEREARKPRAEAEGSVSQRAAIGAQGGAAGITPPSETIADYARSHASGLARAAAGPNRTGLPDRLKGGMEALSGIALDDVRVHRNSARPAQLQALAHTQGSDIHLGPGQDRHLAHEAWHVVQQKQGRVRPTMQLGGTAINDDAGLEQEADRMGARAAAMPVGGPSPATPHGRSTAAPIVQRMRADIPLPAKPTTIADIIAFCTALLGQIDDLNVQTEELDRDLLFVGDVVEAREELDKVLTQLRQIPSPQDPKTMAAIRSASASPEIEQKQQVTEAIGIYDRVRKMLNRSFSDLTKAKNEEGEAEAEAEAQRQKEKKPPMPGPRSGGIWSALPNGPVASATRTFHQYVPDDAATIQQALNSQKLSDSAYIKRKAMWIADPTRYKLSSASGKVRMEYTFTDAGALSLMGEYLLCASGDFAEENPEDWKGEARHPDYTLWKGNEPGAYGIGERRRLQLDAHVVSIKAFDSNEKEIKAKTGSQAPQQAWATRLRVAGEPGVDQEIVQSVVEYLDEHRYDPGRPVLVVSGSQWTCYIRCVLYALNRIGDYMAVMQNLNLAGVFVGSGVTIGSEQEDQVMAAITAATGQAYHVDALSVSPSGRALSNQQLGTKVDLLLTGAHFNLLQ